VLFSSFIHYLAVMQLNKYNKNKMTTREYFIEMVKDELPRFERTLKALPEAELSWRPHPNSRTAQEILTVMSSEAGAFVEPMATGKLDWANVEAGQNFISVNQSVSDFVKGLNASIEQTEKMSEEEWNMPAEMFFGGKSAWKTTRGHLAWSFLLDLIHHRGQLSTYIRPMGGKVPSIYGPSGDSE
jgi:uncharacterized damage-inducible protein DinB